MCARSHAHGDERERSHGQPSCQGANFDAQRDVVRDDAALAVGDLAICRHRREQARRGASTACSSDATKGTSERRPDVAQFSASAFPEIRLVRGRPIAADDDADKQAQMATCASS